MMKKIVYISQKYKKRRMCRVFIDAQFPFRNYRSNFPFPQVITGCQKRAYRDSCVRRQTLICVSTFPMTRYMSVNTMYLHCKPAFPVSEFSDYRCPYLCNKLFKYAKYERIKNIKEIKCIKYKKIGKRSTLSKCSIKRRACLIEKYVNSSNSTILLI